MNLAQNYEKLYKESLQRIESNNYEVDPLLDSKNDHRFGITLLGRPSKDVRDNIIKFLTEIKFLEPNQYYYNDSDIHITVMSIIGCYEGFQLSNIDIAEYIKVINKSLENIKPFTIDFLGLTASPSCIMLKGFFEENTLEVIRENLRVNFKETILQQSIDKRYTIQTAHSTIIRLKEKLTDVDKFVQKIEEYKDHNFGSCSFDKLELVYNDWYQRKDKVKKLWEFTL